MDLFVVNRYWGEGNQVYQNVEEKHQIDNLLSRIEERKRRKHQKLTDAKTVADTSIENIADKQESIQIKYKKAKAPKKPKSVAENYHIEVSEVEDNKKSITTVELAQVKQVDPIDEDSVSKNLEVPEQFTVIGSEAESNRLKANHKLPSWLENPVVIPVKLNKKKDSLKDRHLLLDEKLTQRIRDNGITHFFPVQDKVIPWLLKNNLRCLYHWPRDICVSAPTGSGKTLAFVLPIVQALMERIIPAIRVLVVLPVAELAKQVGAVFLQYCTGTGLKVTVAVGGGMPFFKEHSLLTTKDELIGCQTDILVTTPGRLVSHLRADSGSSVKRPSSLPAATDAISLSQLKFLIVDEADRVAEGSQNDWLSHLMHHLESQVGSLAGLLPPSASTIRKFQRHLHRPPQKLLFSATLSQDPEKLCDLCLFQPKLFSTVCHRKEGISEEEEGEVRGDSTSYVTPEELSEEYIIAKGGESEKPLVLLWLLQQRLLGKSSKMPRALVFASSRRSSSRLALLLSYVSWGDTPITLSHLSSDLPLRNRERILQDFVEGRTNVLACSDALARGVDIPQVDLVISYDPPRHLKNHIHRIGRTGRAGRNGCAITILTPNQLSSFSSIISRDSSMKHAAEISLSPDSLSSLNERYKEAFERMEETLQEEQKKLALVSKKRKRKE